MKNKENQQYGPENRTVLSAKLVCAYANTEYYVQGTPTFILKIGQYSQALYKLHKSLSVQCSTYITACNPHSSLLPPNTNAERQHALTSLLEHEAMIAIPGFARDPDGIWPDEESFLVPGLGEEQARILGLHFQQNAIVHMTETCVPQLIILCQSSKNS